MLRPQHRQSRYRVPPLRQGLIRQAVHQVEVDTLEPRVSGRAKCPNRPVGAVAASQQLQQAVVQALHPYAQAVHPLPQQAATGGVIQVPRVRLYRGLGVRVNAEGSCGRLENRRDVSVRQV